MMDAGTIAALFIVGLMVSLGMYIIAIVRGEKQQEKELQDIKDLQKELINQWCDICDELKNKGGYIAERNVCSYQALYVDTEQRKIEWLRNFDLEYYLSWKNNFPETEFHSMFLWQYDFDKIEYYKCEGSIETQQIISGGGGGNLSLGGAIVGGIVGGEVGALLGGRTGIDSITTTYNKVDDRSLNIYLTTNKCVKIDIQFYEYLLKHIPEKDYDNYIANLKNKGKQ